jgi:DNA-directed RNA polymerase specialized sigma24 family protein
MSFADEVYSMYRDQLQDDEEDAISIVLNLLEEQSHEDLLRLLEGLSVDELSQMLGIYLVEMLKIRMIQDGKLNPLKSFTDSTRLH